MKYSVFGVDNLSAIPADSCLIMRKESGASNESENGDRYVVIGTAERSTHCVGNIRGRTSVVYPLLCLSSCHDDSILEGDMVIPVWALDLLSVPNSSEVYARPVHLELLHHSDISQVVLVYKGRQSYRHWDEVATESSFSVPGSWCTDWPSGLPKKALQKFLPVLLQSRTLVDGAALVLEVLDNTMVRM